MAVISATHSMRYNMKVLMILLCKLLVFIGKLVNKGSSLPGKIVLKLYPNILQKIKLPKYIIAVTGSNGKTSTVEMIANVMSENGLNVVWNKEGSNQTEGIATLLLKNCDLHGNVVGDVVVLESDERYARHTFKHIKPTHFAVTNLYRDQLTRNVHPFWIYDIIKDAADLIPDAEFILNADDPIVSLLGRGRGKVRYFASIPIGMNSINGDIRAYGIPSSYVESLKINCIITICVCNVVLNIECMLFCCALTITNCI